jgi:hypothetical protein
MVDQEGPCVHRFVTVCAPSCVRDVNPILLRALYLDWVFADLMVLKRLRADGTEPAAEEKSDGVISRVDAGLCFDFPASDPNVYYTGTEDGVVHHCSVSYGEQLESFRAHSGLCG